jgi:hypothetical protein
MANYEPLLKALERDHPEGKIVLLNPDDRRNYTLEELAKVRSRPFASQFFMTGINISWTTVWLRTHFTDHAKLTSPTRRIRDLVKATITTQNDVAAKSILADILTQWFEMEPSEYYSLATMMASVLSERGKGITFQIKEGKDDENYMIKSKAEEELARLRFTRLMHIIFSTISIEKFLVKEDGSNIFRLAYCLTKHCVWTGNPATLFFLILKSYGVAIVAFTAEIMLTVFIILSIAEQYHESANESTIQTRMIPLAVLTVFLSILLSMPEIRNSVALFEFYNHETRVFVNPLALMDYVANLALPFVLTIAGFIVIAIQDNFIDAVLNSTALLFILEIDDILPGVLNIDPTHVVRNYLIAEALIELEELRESLKEDSASTRVSIHKNMPDPVQFADLLLTNSRCGGIDIQDSLTFAPYEIKGEPSNPSVSISNYITASCLLSRVEWRYTTGFPLSTNPRIGWLKMWKLGEKDPYVVSQFDLQGAVKLGSVKPVVVDDPHEAVLIGNPHDVSTELYPNIMQEIMIKCSDETVKHAPALRKKRNDALDELNETYRIDGVYMITSFEMSEAILRLRICGSKTATDFMSALDCYSLWDLDNSAERLLNTHVAKESGKQVKPKPPVARQQEA